MNIYLHELKANSKFVINWLIAILCVALIMISSYIAVSKDLDSFRQVLSNYPESIKIAFGINIDKITSILGYFSSFVLAILCVCSAIEAMILGISILSKEIREKTADFLYSKPVSRNKVITSKLLASLTLLIICNIIFIIVVFIALNIVSNSTFDLTTFILIAIIPFIIQLIFFSLGMFISSLMSKVKAVLPISMGIVFGFYILSSFADEKLRAIMPFKYFDTSYILDKSKYELNYVLITIAVIILSTFFTYIIYKKKDIEAV